MANSQAIIKAEIIASFIEVNLTNPIAELSKICDTLKQSSDLATSVFMSTMRGRNHCALFDIKKFTVEDALSNESVNDIVRNLHTKAWNALSDLIKEHCTKATASYYHDKFINNERRLEAMGCPNAENINKVLAEIEGIQVASLELEALKPQLSELAEIDHAGKIKFKGGSFEDKAMLIAKISNIRNRIENICQPVHFKKLPEKSVHEIYNEIADIKKSLSNAETAIVNTHHIKIFNNGNIGVRIHASYSETAFNQSIG